MSVNPLSNQELQRIAPSLFASKPYHRVSDRYHFIPTIVVIENLKRHGWYPVQIQQTSVRKLEKEGFQRHLVRLRHMEDLSNPKPNVVDLLLFNSHDRSTAFTIGAGVYRFVCANGLVVAKKSFEHIKIRHIGHKEQSVAEAVEMVMQKRPLIEREIGAFSSMTLSREQKLHFAQQAAALRFDEHLYVDTAQLLRPKREADTQNDLYTVMNVVQENLIRGGVKGVNVKTNRRFTSKRVHNIEKETAINQGLWSLAQEMAA